MKTMMTTEKYIFNVVVHIFLLLQNYFPILIITEMHNNILIIQLSINFTFGGDFYLSFCRNKSVLIDSLNLSFIHLLLLIFT